MKLKMMYHCTCFKNLFFDFLQECRRIAVVHLRLIRSILFFAGPPFYTTLKDLRLTKKLLAFD